jgi:hypothetical protein
MSLCSSGLRLCAVIVIMIVIALLLTAVCSSLNDQTNFIDLYVAFHKLWCLHALTCVAVTEQSLKIRPFLRYNGYCLAQNHVSYFFYYICSVVISSALEIVVSKYIEMWITVTKVICNFRKSHTAN